MSPGLVVLEEKLFMWTRTPTPQSDAMSDNIKISFKYFYNVHDMQFLFPEMIRNVSIHQNTIYDI